MNISDTEYRNKMEFPMEELATSLAKFDQSGFFTHDGDSEYVETAVKTLNKLYNLLVLTGRYSEEELKVILAP